MSIAHHRRVHTLYGAYKKYTVGGVLVKHVVRAGNPIGILMGVEKVDTATYKERMSIPRWSSRPTDNYDIYLIVEVLFQGGGSSEWIEEANIKILNKGA